MLRLRFVAALGLVVGAALVGCAEKPDPAKTSVFLVIADFGQVNTYKVVNGAIQKTPEPAAQGGTGFFINETQFVTNAHVLYHREFKPADPKDPNRGSWEFSDPKSVVVVDGKGVKHEATLAFSPEVDLDLAVLNIKGMIGTPLTLSRVDPPVRTRVWTIGFPGLVPNAGVTPNSITPVIGEGIVSKLFIDDNWGLVGRGSVRIIGHSAPINHGNSGGPLINACDELLGVNTASPRDSQGVFFSSQATELAALLDRHGVTYHKTERACDATGLPSVWDWKLLSVVIILALLSSAAAVLAMRRPRQQLVQAVESYTQWVRRKGSTEQRALQDKDQRARGEVRQARTQAVDARQWQLSGTDSRGRPLRIPLGSGQALAKGIVLGSAADLTDLQIDDTTVSRRHLRLKSNGDSVLVEDVNSSNGTYVGGQKLQPFALTTVRAGTSLTLGGVTVRLDYN